MVTAATTMTLTEQHMGASAANAATRKAGGSLPYLRGYPSADPMIRDTLLIMSDSSDAAISPDLVRAAIQAAEQRGEDMADVPLTALAAAAGISRSTLLRRIGGSRQALDEAVRAAGVDPGGRQPVRTRAVEAAARVISERGLAAATLETVADVAGCSVHSLYVTFGGRDGLLAAVYESYRPIADFEIIIAERRDSLEEVVRGIYQAMAAGFGRAPQVVRAMLADLFSRPDGPAGRLFQQYFPQILNIVGTWLAEEVEAGRIRPMPVPLLIQQLIAPVTIHFLLRPAMTAGLGLDLPSLKETCEVFADAFVRAVGTDGRHPRESRKDT